MIADQITQVIEVIAEKLGVAVDAVYPMLVNQAKIECGEYHVALWITAIAGALFILSVIALLVSFYYEGDMSIPVSFGFMCITGIVLFFAGIVSLVGLHDYLTALHNPDWWAVEYVLKMIGGH